MVKPPAKGRARPRGRPPLRAGLIVRRSLAASVQRLLENEDALLAGRDIEAVHQARVAVRRLRSDLRSFRGLVDRQWAAPLRQELKWLGSQLGAVRDLDVLSIRLRAGARAVAAGQDPAIKAVLNAVRARRAAARKTLVLALRSERFAALRERLRMAPKTAKLTLAARLTASAAVVPIVRERWKRLRKEVTGLGARPTQADLHRIRILAKRCRYAAEAAMLSEGVRAREFAQAVEGLQDALGEYNDAECACRELRRMRATPALALGANALLALETDAALRARASWSDIWRALDRKALRAWL